MCAGSIRFHVESTFTTNERKRKRLEDGTQLTKASSKIIKAHFYYQPIIMSNWKIQAGNHKGGTDN